MYLFQLPEAEREELMLIRARLLSRVTTVDVTVLTPRTEQQTGALVAVNEILDKLLTRFQTEECKQECERFLNSCLSDPTGPIDDKFQSKVSLSFKPLFFPKRNARSVTDGNNLHHLSRSGRRVRSG